MLSRYQQGDLASPAPLRAEMFGPAENAGPETLPFNQVLPILWRRKFLILACLAVTVGATIIYLRKSTPLYSSTSRIGIEQPTVSLMGNEYPAAVSPNYLATQCEVIKSTHVLELVATKMMAAPTQVTKDGAPSPATTRPTPAIDPAPLLRLQANLSASIDPKADIINVTFISPQSSEAAKVVNMVVDAYKEFHQSETRSNSADLLRTTKIEREKRDAELADAVAKLSEYHKSHPNVGTTDGASVNNMQVTALTTAHIQAQMEALNAENAYGPGHPGVVNAMRREHQIAELLRQAREESAVADAMTEDAHQLQDDVSHHRQQADAADQRYKEASANYAADGGAARISVLEEGHPEERPVWPRKGQLYGLSVLLGLMLGAGTALLSEWMDQRLRTPEETSALLRVPVLGVVPYMKGRLGKVARARQVHLNPSSPVAEAYRTVRTAVYFGLPKGRGRTILVTSTTPGEGKSTTCANLAIAMAQSGERVLLIDADLRKPVQHMLFAVHNDVGLSSVLSGEKTIEQAIQRTDIPGLEMLGCGPRPPNPSEMLNSRPFAELLEQLANRYDRVMLDSPPIMAVADARILGAWCDVTLMTVWAGRSTRNQTAAARDRLVAVGAQILGIIVNSGVDRKSGFYVYGYGTPVDGARRSSTNGESRSHNGNGNGVKPAKSLPEAKTIDEVAATTGRGV